MTLLSQEEMMEVMKESMRMVELLQQGLPRPADSKESPMQVSHGLYSRDF